MSGFLFPKRHLESRNSLDSFPEQVSVFKHNPVVFRSPVVNVDCFQVTAETDTETHTNNKITAMIFSYRARVNNQSVMVNNINTMIITTCKNKFQ